MSPTSNRQLSFEQLYRTHYGQLLASSMRLCGDLSQAEDLVHTAYVKAMKQWPDGNYPAHIGAWLATTTRNGTLDVLRNRQRQAEKLNEQAVDIDANAYSMSDDTHDQHPALRDDMLRLMFTCCHPALHIDARVALCLNTICGLKTDEIAKAFITSEATMAQRLWRAKSKIRNAGIQYGIADNDALSSRVQSVLTSVYLIFNEGWLATTDEPQRFDLTTEAIRLARLLCTTVNEAHDAKALLALMLLQHSRRDARFGSDGALIRLAEQSRELWHRSEINEANDLLNAIFKAGFGRNRYALMAAIAATHANSIRADQTNWNEIVILYEALIALDPSPVIALNHAVAVGERDGAQAGLQAVEALRESAMMQRYYLYHAAQAEFLRRLGRHEDAAQAYKVAIKQSPSKVETRFLMQQLEQP